MPEIKYPDPRDQAAAPAPLRRNGDLRLPVCRLLLQMHAQWKLRAHDGYLQAARFRWPSPACADLR